MTRYYVLNPSFLSNGLFSSFQAKKEEEEEGKKGKLKLTGKDENNLHKMINLLSFQHLIIIIVEQKTILSVLRFFFHSKRDLKETRKI